MLFFTVLLGSFEVFINFENLELNKTSLIKILKKSSLI